MIQTGLVAFDNFHWSDVAVVRRPEHQDGVTDVVGDPQISGVRIEREGSHPVQLGLRALNSAQRGSVAAGIEGVERDRGRKMLA